MEIKQGEVSPEHVCPKCGKVNDGFTSVGETDRPKPGSLGVCAYCQTLLVFVDNGLRRMTDAEHRALPPHVRRYLRNCQLAMAEFARRHKQRERGPS